MDIMSPFRFSLKCYDMGLYLKGLRAKVKYSKFNKLARRNVELRNYKKSDKCYICGNGPSLKKVNLDELDGDTIVMNDHWRIAPNFKTRPTFYMLNDIAYIDDSFRERMLGVLKCFPDIPHILPSSMGATIEKKYNSINTNLYYYNSQGTTFKHNHTIDFTQETHAVWNIVTRAIQLALYLEYKKIYLIGCDYSLFASRYLTHVYDKEDIKTECPFRLRDMLFKYSFTTHIHYEIAEYAKKENICITNLTTESLLDAYDIDSNSKF